MVDQEQNKGTIILPVGSGPPKLPPNMGQEYLLQASDASVIMAPSASVVTVPRRWLNFMRRCLNFKPGRYTVIITVWAEHCDWSVQDAGKVEQ